MARRSALGNGNVILNVKQLQSVSVYGTTVQGGTHKIHIPPAHNVYHQKKNTSFSLHHGQQKIGI